ncbi:MAG: dihydrofolate reductase [Saprospiraceae bacterium]
MNISCVVAVAHNNVIGKDNDIPWYLPADLQYFKKITLNHHILMGRNCYESIGRPLPKRTNVIITRDPFYIVSNCLVAHSIDEALEIAYNNVESEVMIIGGGTIYNQTQNLWDKLYITEVDVCADGDIFFPEIDYSKWKLLSEEPQKADDKNEYDYTFKTYEKV